jgi:hypothetical protein
MDVRIKKSLLPLTKIKAYKVSNKFLNKKGRAISDSAFLLF